jgi:hypothetical protein
MKIRPRSLLIKGSLKTKKAGRCLWAKNGLAGAGSKTILRITGFYPFLLKFIKALKRRAEFRPYSSSRKAAALRQERRLLTPVK